MWNVSGWNISSNDTGHDAAIVNGNRFLTGNGYLGYRGTLEEAAAGDMPATIINGLYDRNGDKWREPVNVPNALSVRLFAGSNELNLSSRFLASHEQSLDFRYGIHSRRTVWQVPGVRGETVSVTVAADRFTSMDDVHLLCLKYHISVSSDISLDIVRGIDGAVYDINGPHLVSPNRHNASPVLEVSCKTLEMGVRLSVASASTLDGAVRVLSNDLSAFERLTLNAEKNQPLVFCVYGAVASELNWDAGEGQSIEIVRRTVARAASGGWDHLRARHCVKWDGIWDIGDVVIDGDDYAQAALRYSLYHLQIIAPRHAGTLSIPARGLSGQTYKGAVFWDTEMFISPYFLCTDPDVVKRFIRYRISTLDGAKRKASSYGHVGAFYAWESQESGDDACSDFNVVDVFTKRPLRTYFRDRQIHISADVVYALREYIDTTGDRSILHEGGLEMAIECARFFMSWIVWVPLRGRYEVPDVIGPDEYHERVANNAFTNRMIKHAFDTALKYLDECEKDAPGLHSTVLEKTGFAPYIGLLREMLDRLYVPSPRADGVIEQFDGYFNHEDCSLETVQSRLLDPKEYWGGGNGVASNTQVIKQADVVLTLALFGNDYSSEIKKANLDYYEPRTEHGSSLSPCVYSLLACATGDSAWAYPFFIKTAEIDMTGKSKQFAGLVYIGGSHPAASGGAWLSTVRGFCGFSVRDGAVSVVPRLPEKWERVSFHTRVAGKTYLITVTKDDYSVCEK